MNQHERINGERMSLGPEHAYMREALFEYAMVQLGGDASGPQWLEIEKHLASCAECRSELEELSQMLRDSYSGALEPSPTAAQPDLSFLPPVPPALPPPAETFTERVKSELYTAIDAAEQIVIQFTQMLLDTLRRPALAGGYRGAHYASYEHPHLDDDVQVSIDISTIDEERKLCRVLVCVVNPAQPFDQEGCQVSLRFGTFTREAVTDHQGYAAFDDISLDFIPQLRFTITPRHPD